MLSPVDSNNAQIIVEITLLLSTRDSSIATYWRQHHCYLLEIAFLVPTAHNIVIYL